MTKHLWSAPKYVKELFGVGAWNFAFAELLVVTNTLLLIKTEMARPFNYSSSTFPCAYASKRGQVSFFRDPSSATSTVEG